MQLAGRRFAPAWWAVLITIATIASFIYLGLWQLDRAEQKRALASHYAAGANRTVPLTSATLAQLPRYQRVQARGHYDRRQVLLDNMPSTAAASAGRPGYHVWTLMHLEDGGEVLVNRGWVPMGRTRQDLPDIAVSETPRTIAGRIDQLPEPGLRLAASVPRGQWPEVLNYPTASDLSQRFGERVPSQIVLLDPNDADGYERVWQARTGFGPERHIGYAVQWFALAAAVLVVFLVVNLNKGGSSP
jgi:surfeit locus 1 family protein